MKIGIFGGTFDPIHYGHLNMAESLREDVGLSKVIFIPTAVSYHKAGESEAELRYEMLKLATEGNSSFEVSDIEIKRGGDSYTYETMRELREIYPNSELYFFVGSDILSNLERWKNADKLLKEVKFVIAMRPNYVDESHVSKIDVLRKTYNAAIETVHAPMLDLSSTEIRARIAERKSVRYMIPDAVREYIEANHLYL